MMHLSSLHITPESAMSIEQHNQSSQASKDLVAKGQKYYLPNYKPREMILDRGKGARIWDTDGVEYLDLGTGIAVNSLGHQDADLVQALTEQAKKLWHTSNVFFTQPPIELAEALVETSGFATRAFFCNSGGEANEAAIKLARKYAADKGKKPEEREIITFTGSFHGRTLATVTATAQPKYQAGFEPLPGGFVYCDPFNNIEAVSKLITDKTCAIMLENIQGEGGITPATPEFLRFLRDECDKRDMLLIFDAVQDGMGRTGKLWAHQHTEVVPDVLTSAKALGCGFPIGAMLVGAKAADTLQFGSHGSTFGGNPMATAVANVALRKINSSELMKNVADRSAELVSTLQKLGEKYGMFEDVRGKGLMIGAALKPEWHGKAGDITEIARQHGVLILVAGPNVLRFLPPLSITAEELAEGLKRVDAALGAYLAA
jgi:acetylornithine/N-succinyldiaminopimelate aminotransferase